MSRRTLLLTEGWKFQEDILGLGKSEGWDKGLPNGYDIRLPHTWNIAEGLEEFRGDGWYQYSFIVDDSWSNQCVRIQFQGVYRTAQLWLNGKEIHIDQASGYLPFEAELTEYIKQGTENVLVVCANNEQTTDGLPYSNSFDWADDGGIYREVTLIRSGNPAIEYIAIQATPQIEQGNGTASGTITSTVYLYNSSVEAVDVSVSIKHINDGTIVYEQQYIDVSVVSNELTLPTIELESVKLWHFDTPELYEITVSIATNGQVSDGVTTSTGFRKISVEGTSFLLNNEPVRLMGVEWMPGSHPEHGMADTEESMEHMLTLMKEANVVFTRFHWQQSEQLLNWCDKHGLLVQEEVPYWQQPFEANEEFTEVAKHHIKSMIRWHNHHPSIFAWGVGNELDGQSEGTKTYVQMMKPFIAALDASRLCNYVSNTFHLNESSDATGHGDLLMWNDYIGTWHEGAVRSDVIAKAAQYYPQHPLFVVEYGLCEPAFDGGDERRIQILEDQTACYAEHDHIAGAIFFSLNDYRTQMGEDGQGKLRQRVHGVTDLYGNVKPSYWNLREVSSPLTVGVHSVEGDHIKLEVRCKAQLPSYTVKHYELAYGWTGEDVDSTGESASVAIPKLAPGEHTILTIPYAADKASAIYVKINRGTGFSVVDRFFEL